MSDLNSSHTFNIFASPISFWEQPDLTLAAIINGTMKRNNGFKNEQRVCLTIYVGCILNSSHTFNIFASPISFWEQPDLTLAAIINGTMKRNNGFKNEQRVCLKIYLGCIMSNYENNNMKCGMFSFEKGIYFFSLKHMI